MNKLVNHDSFEGVSGSAESIFLFEYDVRQDALMMSSNALLYFNLPENNSRNTLTHWMQRIHPDDRESIRSSIVPLDRLTHPLHPIQFRALNADGTYVWLRGVGEVMRGKDGSPSFFLGAITQLDHQNSYDPVTKCPSMQRFLLSELNKPCILMLLGMDGFREVVNNCGFETGNRVLYALAETIKETTPGALVYRMPGDEFLVVLPGQGEASSAACFSQWLYSLPLANISADISEAISFSGGAMTYIPSTMDKEAAIRRLGSSLKQAKKRGHGQLVFFSSELAESFDHLKKLRAALTDAVKNGCCGFELYYQAIINNRSQTIVGLEALLRFHTEELGLVQPSDFIPLLEESREIRTVGIWVMEEVFRQKKAWDKLYPDLSFWFNVSYYQLYNDEFIHRMMESAQKIGVDPRFFVMELTESCRVEHPDSLANMMSEVRKNGFRVALDDFGMGNTSFSLLRDLPVDIVKIDHSFVSTLKSDQSLRDQTNLAIISSIHHLCKELGQQVVVEGIENETIARLIGGMGVQYLQGYFYSRPISAKDTELLLTQRYTPASFVKDKTLSYQERQSRVNHFTWLVSNMDQANGKGLLAKGQHNVTRNTVLYHHRTNQVGLLLAPGYPFTLAIGQLVDAAAIPSQAAAMRTAFAPDTLMRDYANGKREGRFEYRRRPKDGVDFWASVEYTLCEDPDSEDLIVFMYSYDISDRVREKHMIDRLAVTEYDLLLLIDVTTGQYEIKNLNGVPGLADAGVNFSSGDFRMIQKLIFEKAPRAERKDLERQLDVKMIVQELEQSEVYSMTYSRLDESGAFYRRKKLQFCYLDDTKTTIFGYRSDITSIYRQEQQELLLQTELLKKAAYTDALTGVQNRAAYVERENDLDARVKGGSIQQVLVCQMDLNNLKYANDHFGHSYGDQMLKAAAKIITESFSREGSVYRTGGDEFIVFLIGERAESAFEKCRLHMLQAEKRYNQSAGVKIPLEIAYGTAVYRLGGHTDSLEDAAKAADKRMYRKKSSQKKRLS
jgi:diguanylate cyclase (GGDEF)-like protein